MKPKKKILIAAAAALTALLAGKLFWRGEFLYAGTIEATEVDISPRLSSTIASFAAQEGRSLRAGEAMVTLSCEDVKLAADIAERDFKRAQRLRDGSMTQEAYERLKNKRDDAALKLDWCVLKAPMDATVLSTYHEPGESVSPGMKLLTLADLGDLLDRVPHAPRIRDRDGGRHHAEPDEEERRRAGPEVRPRVG